MSACERLADRIEAYHDGELAGLARWRVRRHLAACEHCTAALEGLSAIGDLLREDASASPGPDLWSGISARLPALDAELDADLARRSAPVATPPPRRWSGFLAPLPIGVGGLVAAAAALVLLLPGPGLPLEDAVVEELDAMGRSVAVLPSDEKSTIIWVLDPSPVASAKESSGEVL